jgi:hypothetical protein
MNSHIISRDFEVSFADQKVHSSFLRCLAQAILVRLWPYLLYSGLQTVFQPSLPIFTRCKRHRSLRVQKFVAIMTSHVAGRLNKR